MLVLQVSFVSRVIFGNEGPFLKFVLQDFGTKVVHNLYVISGRMKLITLFPLSNLLSHEPLNLNESIISKALFCSR